ncbi:MAG: hypothetical protein QM730_06695 [Anaerolineales bacterium]
MVTLKNTQMLLNGKVNGFNQILGHLAEVKNNVLHWHSIRRHQLLYKPGARILVGRNIVRMLQEAEEHSSYSGFQPFWSKENIDIVGDEEWSNKDWILWKFGDCSPSKFDFVKFAENNVIRIMTNGHVFWLSGTFLINFQILKSC